MDDHTEHAGDGRPAGALTAGERRRVLVASAVPVGLVLAVLLALVAAGRLTPADVVVGTVLYGGLLGMTAGVLAHEHAAASHCPRCGEIGQRGSPACVACGYDLARAPVYLCEQRHERAYDPGVCRCGRRLQEREPAQGLGRSVRRTLWVGAWLLALLVGTGLILRLTG